MNALYMIVNIFNSGTVQVNVSVRMGESEDKVMVCYGTCRFMSCHHNILNGLMKVKTKLGFIHKKTYTTESERICPGIFFSLFIYRISCVKNICEICSAIHTKIKFHVKIL